MVLMPSQLRTTCCVVQVLARQGRARASRLTLRHGVCQTPMFMPVGTRGVQLIIGIVKSTTQQLEEPGSQLVLGNMD